MMAVVKRLSDARRSKDWIVNEWAEVREADSVPRFYTGIATSQLSFHVFVMRSRPFVRARFAFCTYGWRARRWAQSTSDKELAEVGRGLVL